MSIWNSIITTGSVVGASTALLTAAYQVDLGPVLTRDLNAYDRAAKIQLEEVRQLAQNAAQLSIQTEFKILFEKQKICNCLTFDEQQELCRLARSLGYSSGVPGC